MWTHLEPQSATLEQVFWPLSTRASEFDRSWSIAELNLRLDAIDWLKSWFSNLTPDSTENWVKSVTFTKFSGDAFASYRQMFGSVLICLGAEVCREVSSEDAVWPAIRRILPGSHALHRELFLSNGQPSQLTKEIISDAVRVLNLRHAMDIEGTQQWFATIKLQFGFTYRGAKNRLAEWLVNLGRPHAVQYLNGESIFPELASDSFQTMWSVLTQYRRGLIEDSEVRQTLCRNPWIRLHWIDDLLKEAKARIETLGTGESRAFEPGTFDEEVPREEPCPVVEVSLVWPQSGVPRLQFLLDRQTIEEAIGGSEVGELDFYIDDRKLCRWLRQENGAWAGTELINAEPDSLQKTPNLRPRTLAVRSRSGDAFLEWDLADSGLAVSVLVFDLDRAIMVRALEERLEVNRRYAILCDRNTDIQGCKPGEVFERHGVIRKAIRLPTPLNENICLQFGEFVLWQPVRPREAEQRMRFTLTLKTPANCVLPLNDRAKLVLEGLPSDVTSALLLIHQKTCELEKMGDIWLSAHEITLTPEFVAGQRNVRIRFSFGDRVYTQTPRLVLNVLGVAMLHHQRGNDAEVISFEVLKDGSYVNRNEGTTTLRVWAPNLDPSGTLFESECQVGRLRHNKIRLRDIPGHGGTLQIQSSGRTYDLGILCEDTGCVAGFVPAILGNDAQLSLLQEKDPEEGGMNGYSLWEWTVGEKGKSKLHPLPAEAILRRSSKRRWWIQCSKQPMAMALTWKGVWLGAWWNLDLLKEYAKGRMELSEQEFAIIKWLRVPILHSTILPTLKSKAVKEPCRFLRAWLSDDGIPNDVVPNVNTVGNDSIVRQFLWNDFPPGNAGEAIEWVTHRDPSWNQAEKCIGYLAKLSAISPVLLWKGLETCLKRNRGTMVQVLNGFVFGQVGLSPNAPERKMQNRLRGIVTRVSNATGVYEERLREITSHQFSAMENQQWQPSAQDCLDLLRVGQTQSGQKYIAASMALYWINLSRRGV